MSDFSFTIGSITITPFFWSLVLAAFFSSFSVWRKLKEDFKEEEIFKITLAVLFFALIFARLFFIIGNFSFFRFSFSNWLFLNYKTNFSLNGLFWGVVFACFWQAKRTNKDVWEVLDAFSTSIFYLMILGGIGQFLKTDKTENLFNISGGFGGLLLYQIIKGHYRSWTWYKSGKIGFLFWFSTIYVFLILLALDFFQGSVLYWEKISWVATLLVSLLVIYQRAERILKEDLKKWLKLFSHRNYWSR